MAKKKVTLETLATTLRAVVSLVSTQGKEIRDLASATSFIVENMVTKDDPKGMATKEDIKEVLGHVVNMHEQVNNIEAELKPLTRARLPDRTTSLEIEVFGGSKAPRVQLPKA
jgi:hypothetical protein